MVAEDLVHFEQLNIFFSNSMSNEEQSIILPSLFIPESRHRPKWYSVKSRNRKRMNTNGNGKLDIDFADIYPRYIYFGFYNDKHDYVGLIV